MVTVLSHLFKSAQKQLTEWQVEPYLHLDAEKFYNPLTDRTIHVSDSAYAQMTLLSDKKIGFRALPPPLQERLISERWVVPPAEATDDRFFLKYASLEANVACNQSCYFCPVSISPRVDNVMSLELYEKIVQQLVAYKSTLQGLFMNHYNEPTVDRFFVDRIRILKKHGINAALLTNGSGLTPKRIDAMIEMGGIRFLSVNLSTIDHDRYRQDRGKDQLEVVLRNLEYAQDRQIAEEQGVIVLGMEDDVHRENYERIKERFAGTRFTVKSYRIDSRSQFMPVGAAPAQPHKHLRGCDQSGSRPLQHLHVTGDAKAILCCQDYNSEYIVGDLNTQTIEEILTGDQMGLMRRWTYGIEEAPENFICRHCSFALTR